MATTTHTMHARGLMASLTATDIQQSLDYYAGLGFEVTDRSTDDNGAVLGVSLTRDPDDTE